MRVVRLKNSKQGQPYNTELIETSTEEDAEKLAAKWWSSGGTLGVVILEGRVQVARSEKPYLNPTRVPWDSWPAKEGNPPPIRANAGAQVMVHRLKEGLGPYYQHDKKQAASVDDANGLAAQWWEEPETISVLVLVVNQRGGVMEDARYVQPRMDLARVPPTWMLPEGVKREEKPPDPPPDLPEPAPSAAPIFDVPLPKEPEPQKADGCVCCMKPVPDEPDPLDDDRTPSGRIANYRCPVCGQLVGQHAWQLYWEYEKRLAASHAALPKPWNQP